MATLTPPPLPKIPEVPKAYTGPDAASFQATIDALRGKMLQSQGQVDLLSQYLGGKISGADRTSFTNQRAWHLGELARMGSELNDSIAGQLTAKEGVAANTRQTNQLGALPGLQSYLSENLTGQSQYALDQLQPLIEQRLNALGILNSGALPAVSGKAMTDLLAAQGQQMGNFMTGALGQIAMGGSDDMFNATMQNLLGATQRSFAENDIARQQAMAYQMQAQAMQAQKDLQRPFWQDLLLGVAGGAGQAGGAAGMKYLLA